MSILEIKLDHKFSTSVLKVMPKSRIVRLTGKQAKEKFIDSNINEIGVSINKHNPDTNIMGIGFEFETQHALGDYIFQIEWNDQNSGFDVHIKGTFAQELPDGFQEMLKEDGEKASLFITGLKYREGVVRGFASDLINYEIDDVSTAIKITNYKFI